MRVLFVNITTLSYSMVFSLNNKKNDFELVLSTPCPFLPIFSWESWNGHGWAAIGSTQWIQKGPQSQLVSLAPLGSSRFTYSIIVSDRFAGSILSNWLTGFIGTHGSIQWSHGRYDRQMMVEICKWHLSTKIVPWVVYGCHWIDLRHHIHWQWMSWIDPMAPSNGIHGWW